LNIIIRYADRFVASSNHGFRNPVLYPLTREACRQIVDEYNQLLALNSYSVSCTPLLTYCGEIGVTYRYVSFFY